MSSNTSFNRYINHDSIKNVCSSGNLKTDEKADLLITNFDSIQSFINDKDPGCFEIIRLTKK